MTDAVQVALIAGGALMIPQLLNTWMAYQARIASERAITVAEAARTAAARSEQISHEVKAVSVETAHRIDGRMDELLELTRKNARREGMAEQKGLEAAQSSPTLPATVQRQEDGGNA